MRLRVTGDIVRTATGKDETSRIPSPSNATTSAFSLRSHSAVSTLMQLCLNAHARRLRSGGFVFRRRKSVSSK